MTMIRPIKKNLIVRLRERQSQSSGGIAIPEKAQEAEEWGVVLAVGDDVEHIQVDDIVFIRKTQGTHIVHGGQDVILIEEPRVLCKLENERPID